MKKMYKGVVIMVAMAVFVQPVFAFTLQESAAYSKKQNVPEIAASTVFKSASSTLQKNKLETDNIPLDYVAGEVLVKYKEHKINLETLTGKTAASKFALSNALEKKEDFTISNISVLKITDSETVAQKIAELENDPNVEYAEPNYRRFPAEISTNDTHRGLLWGLDNTGQPVGGTSGTSDADVDAPEAWLINEGTNASVIVAIIDDGVAYNHPDLLQNMWDGSSCKNESGGTLGNCNHGYDFENNDTTPLPTEGSHGTNIAGIIAAAKNNSIGIVGVAPEAQIMAIKFAFDIASEIRAIDFAIANGAKVINASFGGTEYSEAEYAAIARFRDAGGIFVAAAGNGATDNETSPIYPSDYDLENIISVAATDQNDELASFSNYSATSVDVGAPGVNVYSTEGYRIFNEDFEDVTPPSIGIQFTQSQSGNATWGTKSSIDNSNKALFGDHENWGAYQENVVSHIDSAVINLSGKPNSYLNFAVLCDTEEGFDGIILSFWNGSAWVAQSAYTGLGVLAEEISLSDFATNDFKFRLTWVANESVSGSGCFIDDIKIVDSDSANEAYEYTSGTSMAAPYVAGLAALIQGYNPSLTATEVKQTILNSGDSLDSLHGKTVSGKRINAQKALEAVTPAKAVTGFEVPSQVGETVINEEAHTIALTVPFGTDVSALVPTIEFTGASLSPESGVAQDFTSPVTYTVTAADGSTQAYVVTVNVVGEPDTTAPVITLVGSSTVNLTVGDVFEDEGATAVDDVDGDITNQIEIVNSVNTSVVGAYTITYNVSDAAGNPATEVTRTVNVSDVDAPIFTGVPNNYHLEATSIDGAELLYALPTATDDADGAVPVTCAPESGTMLAFGTHTIECSASDTTRNVALASFTVTVADTAGPVISDMPANQTIEIPTGTSTTAATYSLPTASDVVEGPVTVVCAPESDTMFSIGASTVECSAADSSSNVTTESFTITVSTPPPSSVGNNGGSSRSGGGGSSKKSSTAKYAVEINQGDSKATSTAVVLTIASVSGAKHMQVSNSSSFASATWTAFKSTYPWTLTDGSGTKTVYVRYGDRNKKVIGNAKDSITLAPPIALSLTQPAPLVPLGQVLGAVQYNFVNTLMQGSAGPDVIELQKVLIAAGHLKIASPTGFYGPITATAVKAYQGAHNLEQTGVVGPSTLSVLNKPVSPMMSNEQILLLIKQLQAKLVELRAKLTALTEG